MGLDWFGFGGFGVWGNLVWTFYNLSMKLTDYLKIASY